MKATILAASALILAQISSPAKAGMCGSHDVITKRLVETFKEKRRGYGQISGKAIIEIFVSENGAWSVIQTGINGMSCVVASGTGWETLPEGDLI